MAAQRKMNAHMSITQRDASSHMQAVRSRIRYTMLHVYRHHRFTWM